MSTETASPWADEVAFSIRIKPIAFILLAGLILRLSLASLPGFGYDLDAFQAWSLQLADRGPWNFYNTDFFADYAPGYLYILWLFGGLNTIFAFDADQFHYLLKLPAIAADLASVHLLYRLLAGQKPVVQLGAPILYLLLPMVLLIGPVWGQVDSILAFFLLLTVYYLARGRPVAASLAYVVGFLIKPQAIAALPVFAFWILRNHPPRTWLDAASSSLAAGFFLILPFFPNNPLGVFQQLANAADVPQYRVTSFFAYNFWGLFGMFRPDDLTFWGLEYRYWGIALFLAASLGVIFVFRHAKSPGLLALATALSVLAFYIFLTRMHERYLFPLFLPLLAACSLSNSRLLWASFLGLGIAHFFNLDYVYSYYYPNFLKVGALFSMIEYQPSWWGLPSSPAVFLLSLSTTMTFPLLLAISYRLTRRREAEPLAR